MGAPTTAWKVSTSFIHVNCALFQACIADDSGHNTLKCSEPEVGFYVDDNGVAHRLQVQDCCAISGRTAVVDMLDGTIFWPNLLACVEPAQGFFIEQYDEVNMYGICAACANQVNCATHTANCGSDGLFDCSQVTHPGVYIDLQKRVATCTMQDGCTATNGECLVAGTGLGSTLTLTPETEPWRTQLFCTEVEAGYWLDRYGGQPLGPRQLAWKPMSPAAGYVHKCTKQPHCGNSADFCVGQYNLDAFGSQFSFPVGSFFFDYVHDLSVGAAYTECNYDFNFDPTELVCLDGCSSNQCPRFYEGQTLGRQAGFSTNYFTGIVEPCIPQEGCASHAGTCLNTWYGDYPCDPERGADWCKANHYGSYSRKREAVNNTGDAHDPLERDFINDDHHDCKGRYYGGGNYYGGYFGGGKGGGYFPGYGGGYDDGTNPGSTFEQQETGIWPVFADNYLQCLKTYPGYSQTENPMGSIVYENLCDRYHWPDYVQGVESSGNGYYGDGGACVQSSEIYEGFLSARSRPQCQVGCVAGYHAVYEHSGHYHAYCKHGKHDHDHNGVDDHTGELEPECEPVVRTLKCGLDGGMPYMEADEMGMTELICVEDGTDHHLSMSHSKGSHDHHHHHHYDEDEDVSHSDASHADGSHSGKHAKARNVKGNVKGGTKKGHSEELQGLGSGKMATTGTSTAVTAIIAMLAGVVGAVAATFLLTGMGVATSQSNPDQDLTQQAGERDRLLNAKVKILEVM